MTNLVCPLCGRRVNMERFDPTGYDLDISAVEVTGLGRGRGFKEVGKYSILDPGNPTVELIKDRVLALAQMLLRHKCLNVQELIRIVPFKLVDLKELRKREYQVKALSQRTLALTHQLNENEIRFSEQLTNVHDELDEKDSLIKDLSEETISLKEQVEDWKEQTGEWKKQAETRQAVVDSQDETIEWQNTTITEQNATIRDLEAQIEDLGEALIADYDA